MLIESKRSIEPGKQTKGGKELFFSARDLNRLLGVAEVGSDAPVLNHRTVKEGKYLLRAGEPFDSLYVVNAGFFKTVFTDDGGNEQVVGFPVKGEMLGTDGIGDLRYLNDVVALSDADVIVIPFKDLSALASLIPGLDETVVSNH